MVVDQTLEKVREIIEAVEKEQSLEEGDILLNCLHRVQDVYQNFVPSEAAELVAERLKVPLSKVYEVLTFYTMFNTKPVGRHHVQVCRTLSCWLRGAKGLTKAVESKAGIRCGETDKDGRFTLTEVERQCPQVSRDMIRRVLRDLDQEGLVECLGRGPGARWRVKR